MGWDPISWGVGSSGGSGSYSVYVPSWGSGATSSPETVDAPSTVDTELVSKSAYGQEIPIFRGAGRLLGLPIAAADIAPGSGDDLRGTIALVFARNAFNRPVTLLRLFGNDRLLAAAPGMGSPVKGATIRFYDGIDNALDPWLETIYGAGETPVHEGYVMAVIENLNVTALFQDSYPVFTAELGDDVTTTTSTTVATTSFTTSLSVPDYYHWMDCYDYLNHRVYSLFRDASAPQHMYLGTISLEAMTELSRVECEYEDFTQAIALPGGDYLCGTTDSGAFLDVIDVFTGMTFRAAKSANEFVACSAQYYGSGEDGFVVLLHNTSAKTFKIAKISISTQTITYTDVGLPTLVARTGACHGEAASSYCQFFAFDEQRIFEISFASGAVTWAQIFDSADPTQALTAIAYDSRTPGVVMSYYTGSGSNPSQLAKIDLTGTVVWTRTFAVLGSYHVTDGRTEDFDSGNAFERGLYGRLRPGFALINRGGSNSGGTIHCHLLDCSDGTSSDIGEPIQITGIYDQYSGNYYFYGGDTLSEQNVPPQTFWTRNVASTAANAIPISEVIEDFATFDGGIDVGYLTFSGLSSYTCKGFNFTSDFRLSDTIRSISEVYGISTVESDGGVKFVRKPQNASLAIDVTLDADDVVEQPDSDMSSSLASFRAFATDVPSALEIQYIDPDRDFAQGQVEHRRPRGAFDAASSRRKESISLPLSISAGDAKIFAIERLYAYVANQNGHKFVLPPEYAYVEPSDLLQIPTERGTVVVQVSQATMREDFTQDIEAVEFLTDTTTSSAASTGLVPNYDEDPFGLTRYFHLDIPLMSPQHDTGSQSIVQYHVLTGRGQEVWNGGYLFRSRTGGDFAEIDRVTGIYPVAGIVLASIGVPAVYFSTDLVNELTVVVTSGDSADLTAATYLAVMNGANLGAYGRPGRWEIIAWQDVTTNADGSVTLSTLQRGLRGTEVYCGSHEIGDWFVAIPDDHVSKVEHVLADLDTSYYYKAFGNPEFQIAPIEYKAITGAAETPFAPCHLDAALDGSDIDLTWTRRTRLNGIWAANGSNIPLGETTESYDVEIMDGVTVKRTLAGLTSEATTYTAAQITADWGSTPATLKWRVYQNSSVVTRGHMAEITSTIS